MTTQDLKRRSLLLGKHLILRDATVDDSEFILALRTDPRKGKYLSKTDPSIDEQRNWMRVYSRRLDQAYFIIESRDEQMLGCIRMYNPNKEVFEWGSWVIVDGAAPFVALESALLVYQYATELGFKRANVDVKQENTTVWRFHETVFGARLVDEDEHDRFYVVDKDSIDRALKKHERLLTSRSS